MTSRARRSIARQVVIWALGVVLAVAAAGVAAAGELGLITGRQTGTYFRFGHDLKRLVRPSGIDVVVHPSNGALDNLFAVSRRGGIHLGIVQSDILTFVANQHANPSLARIARNVHTVFPLFSEEVHVLGRRDIGDFEQLAAGIGVGVFGHDAEPFGQEGRCLIDERDRGCNDDDPETLMAASRGDHPGEDQRHGVSHGCEQPRRLHRQPP